MASFRQLAFVLVLNPVVFPIGIAEIEHIDHERRENALHLDVTEGNAIDDTILPAAPARLDAHAAVGAFEETAFHPYISKYIFSVTC
jgi:hypothetical protein